MCLEHSISRGRRAQPPAGSKFTEESDAKVGRNAHNLDAAAYKASSVISLGLTISSSTERYRIRKRSQRFLCKTRSEIIPQFKGKIGIADKPFRRNTDRNGLLV